MSLTDLLKKDIAPSFGLSTRSWLGAGTAWFRQKHQHDLRAVLTQVEAIVRTNSPLPEGLLKCSLDAPNARCIFVLRKMSEKVDAGMVLADAMGTLGRWFPAFYIDQVRAGEATGQLGDALRSIIAGINADFEAGRSLRNHLAYFLFLAIGVFGIGTFLMAKVFPVFFELLEEFDDLPPPPSARALVWFYENWQDHEVAILAGAVAAMMVVVLLRALYRFSGAAQSGIVGVVLAVPSLRRMFRRTQIERISRALELRLAGGVPLPQALRDTVARGLPRPYGRMLERCATKVESGARLSEALTAYPWLTGRELPELVRMGEMREDLVWAFREIGAQCARANRRAKRVWIEAMVPIGVVLCSLGVMAAAVGMFGIFAAMTDGIVADL